MLPSIKSTLVSSIRYHTPKTRAFPAFRRRQLASPNHHRTTNPRQTTQATQQHPLLHPITSRICHSKLLKKTTSCTIPVQYLHLKRIILQLQTTYPKLATCPAPKGKIRACNVQPPQQTKTSPKLQQTGASLPLATLPPAIVANKLSNTSPSLHPPPTPLTTSLTPNLSRKETPSQRPFPCAPQHPRKPSRCPITPVGSRCRCRR